MSRNYDNWERLVAAAIKKQQFRAMALAPPSSESNSRQSDPISFSSANHHVGLPAVQNGATPGGVTARAALRDHSFDFCPELYLGQLEIFSLLELRVATDNFSNKNILGKGGFSHVYKGKLADNTLVAVKRLTKEGGDLQFKMEVETISLAVHPNLLKLRGFCMTPTEKLLIYPYMANGSFASWLRDRPESQLPLDWPTRKRIALGSARGLAYLHQRSIPIIHCDVKAANILLDEDFEAVVGDFGLSKVFNFPFTTDVCGTTGHICPEYLSTGIVYQETDVYAYGVMLLELITGQKAFNVARHVNGQDVMLVDWVKRLLREKQLDLDMLVDADLNGNYIDEEVEQLIQIALLCTRGSPSKRPDMSGVVRMLQEYGLTTEWREEKILSQEFNRTQYPNNVQISSHDYPDSRESVTYDSVSWGSVRESEKHVSQDSCENMDYDELSGPR